MEKGKEINSQDFAMSAQKATPITSVIRKAVSIVWTFKRMSLLWKWSFFRKNLTQWGISRFEEEKEDMLIVGIIQKKLGTLPETIKQDFLKGPAKIDVCVLYLFFIYINFKRPIRINCSNASQKVPAISLGH